MLTEKPLQPLLTLQKKPFVKKILGGIGEGEEEMAEYSLEFVFDSIFGCEDVSFSVKDFLYSGVVGFLAGETFEFSNIINLPNELRSYFNGKGQAESAEEIKIYFNSVNPKILKSIATGNLELVGKVMKDIPAESFNNASKLLDSTAKKPDDYLRKNSKVNMLDGASGFVAKADDVIEFENFKEIIGDDFTYDLDSFKKMKYNEPEKWAYSNELKNYLVKYPDSNKKYFDAFLELKKEKIKEGVLLPPKQKQAFLMPEGKHDPYHIFHRMLERNITDDDLKTLMKDSKAMFSQWNGQRQLFVGEKGACVIVKQGDFWIYKTAWFKNDNDEEFDKILEVLKNVGL